MIYWNSFCFFVVRLSFVVQLGFCESTSASIISLHVIAELSIILAKYFPFSQLPVEGFQI